MTAVDVAWAIGIAIPLIIFAALVAAAVRRHLAEAGRGRHRLDHPTDPEADAEILRRATRAWQAFADTHDYGPCRYCRTSGSECVPHVRWCCNRCADDPRAHPIVEKKGGAA